MRTMDPDRQQSEVPHDRGRSLARAWISVAVIPVFAILAFALGEGTVSVLGYPVGGTNPLWVSLVSDVVVCVILLVPCLAAVFFGLKARAAGVARAWLPTVLGAVFGLATLVLTIATEIGNYT